MLKLNLGCGPTNFGKDWIHIDSGEFDHIDKRYKSIVDLDFEAESVDLIYASHVLEYFDRKEATKVLLEWFRVLKNGGILRLAVPDFEVMANLYCKGEYPLDRFLGPLYGKMTMALVSKMYVSLSGETQNILILMTALKLIYHIWIKIMEL